MQALMERVAFRPVSTIQVKPRWQLDPDLRLYLPLWNPIGDVFLSQDAYGHTITRYGATNTGQGGVEFDGSDDYLSVGNPTALGASLLNDFTVAMWVNLDATQPSSLYDPISHGHSSTQGWVWQANGGTDNNMEALYADGSAIAGPNWGDLRGLGWLFLVAVKSASEGILIYRGGQWVATTATAAAKADVVLIAGKALEVGRDDNGRYLKGREGDVWIHSRPFSALEVLNLFDQTKGRYGGG